MPGEETSTHAAGIVCYIAFFLCFLMLFHSFHFCLRRIRPLATSEVALDLVKFLREHFHPCDESTCHAAALAEHWEILQWGWEQLGPSEVYAIDTMRGTGKRWVLNQM
jgi:hypothetical protein